MILGKLWKALAAQMNKVANFFWTADPIAQLQYEYDKAVDQMKEVIDKEAQQDSLCAQFAAPSGPAINGLGDFVAGLRPQWEICFCPPQQK